MPTAAEFEWAGRELDRCADRSRDLLATAGLILGPDVLCGGRLTLLTVATIDVAERNAARASELLSDAASLCRLRAEICQDHADALAAHHDDLRQWEQRRATSPSSDRVPPRPRRPRPPADWVEV